MDKYRKKSTKSTLLSNPIYMKDLILHIETVLVMLLSLLRGYETSLPGYSCLCVLEVCLSVAELELGGDTFVV